MIFVTLGTQDKSFERLLKAIDKEIEKGNIKDKVIVQAGYTKYESKNMEIFDLISSDRFEELMSQADLVITHGGAGSILSAIKKDKIVIACPREKKYMEHTNDHQKELVEEFSKKGYILAFNDSDKLVDVLKKAKNFKPIKFQSNTKNMINLISKYIEKDNHTSWWNKYNYIIKYLIFFIIYISIYRYSIQMNDDILDYGLRLQYVIYISLLIVSFISNKYIVFKDHKRGILKFISQLIFYGILTSFAYIIAYSFNNYYIAQNVFFILTILFYKYIIFNDKRNFIDKYFGNDEDEKEN